MHIEPTSHEHGLSGKVYTYEGEFNVGDDVITWNAKVSHAQDVPRVVTGTIPITTPAIAAIADKAVRDAIVKSIDAEGAIKTTATAAPSTATQTPPIRSLLHDALEMFVGEWRAEGMAYGSANQSIAHPKADTKPWKSTHSARWLSGRFFLVQDETAHIGNDPLDTMTVMGVDAQSGQLFAAMFENHGYERRYEVKVDGRRWTLDGDSERALIDFSADGRTQRIVWEWKPRDRWLPLCERTAVRVD
jgi:Protein of unknown function (DUF1579)